MKFSFQMVVVAFVVTLAHLVVLATVSPVRKDSARQAVRLEIESVEEELELAGAEIDSVEETSQSLDHEIESFPVKSNISVTESLEDTPERQGAGEVEMESDSLLRDEPVEAPRTADLAEVSPEKSQPVSRQDSVPAGKNGPHEVRQIEPKPRS